MSPLQSSHSFFFAKTLPLPPSQFHSQKKIMVFFLVKKIKIKTLPLPPQFHSRKRSWGFYFWSKTLAKHCIVIVQWLPLSSYFHFFFVKKSFAEALIVEKKFLLEIIQNIDANSTFDRMLWLNLQQW